MSHRAIWCHAILFLLAFVLVAPSQAQVPDDLRAQLNEHVKAEELAGVVAMIVDRDKTLTTITAGFADKESSKPMAEDSVFWIASQSKPMTAVLVMMFVDEKKISLDDPVEKYLPNFREQMVVIEKDDQHRLLRKPDQSITVRMLLSHMSGMPFQTMVERPTLDALPLKVAVDSYAMTALDTQPGTNYKYSNAGINTAARIVEVVSGKKYEDLMRERLFDPLGMKDTTFWPSDAQVQRLAKSYKPNADKTHLQELQIAQLIYPLSSKSDRYPMPAGGLFSTASDVAKFCQLMLHKGKWNNQQLLSEEAIKELTRRQTPETVKESYGLGFTVASESFGHGGAHATNMEIHPEKGLATIWMVQHAGYLGNGASALGTFKKWAVAQFAK